MIKNEIQFTETHMRHRGASNEEINQRVADIALKRGPIGTGRYACTCNNWGPRFIENSDYGCCPGCWAWALDHHQEMDVAGVKPPTREMIRTNTWGINVAQLDKNKIHKIVDNELQLPVGKYLRPNKSGVPITTEKIHGFSHRVEEAFNTWRHGLSEPITRAAVENRPEDKAGLNWDLLDFLPEDK